MSEKIKKLLNGQGGNYILPFFWQHGEDEQTLRTYMRVIQEANIGAVCVESRPHPDFAGPQWWHDMDIILDEARKRNMQVWILDDSHFPTGFANGAMADQPDELCRQSILHQVWDLKAGESLTVSEKAPARVPTMVETFAGEKDPRVFDDDRLLGVYAIGPDGSTEALPQTLTAAHDMKVCALWLSRNYGYHTKYINMCQWESVRVLIDAVYEPHWAHYKDDFGKTIAGFFSDEPELGNGHLYEQTGFIGNPEMDYPWSPEIEEALQARLGDGFPGQLYQLFEEGPGAPQVRLAYMDVLTELVKKDFSYQLGDWCRAHGVQYIGHLIEDNDMHVKTGSSLGHYFRGLAGQDWAGIDDIGGQVYPQGEDDSFDRGPFRVRNGQFYHYMLGKLASSAAAIEPLKKGRSMCEIFGAYGWKEGVRLEKYLVDHFMVRGVNHFVPHAFSAKDFPDPDCPPHFYAHGHNPQYRHFGALMAYTNRVLELINDGRHVAGTAVLYHGDSSWMGDAMPSHAVGRVLADAQIEFDYIPQDVFTDPASYNARVEDGKLIVNTQTYHTLIVPACAYVRPEFIAAAQDAAEKGVNVYYVDQLPQGVRNASLMSLDGLAIFPWGREIRLDPADQRMRYLHYEHTDGSGLFLFVNEGTETYTGTVQLRDTRHAYRYNAWDNMVEPADYDGSCLQLCLEPLDSFILVLDPEAPAALSESFGMKMQQAEPLAFSSRWQRSLAMATAYPDFADGKEVDLPDTLEKEEPLWSGIARYENTFSAEKEGRYLLEITDAAEGVEVFVNGESLGIQIVPTFRFDLTQAVRPGENRIAVEVATTLERETSTLPNQMAMFQDSTEPTSRSGLCGEVRLYYAQG